MKYNTESQNITMKVTMQSELVILRSWTEDKSTPYFWT